MKNENPLPCTDDQERRVSGLVLPASGASLAGHRGFTLVELLIVCGFIGVLVTMALASYNTYIKLAQTARAISEIRNIDKSINAFSVEKGTYPTALSDLGPVPLDPWGNPYRYYNIITGGGTPYMDVTGITPLNTDYDLYSIGPDGQTAKELTLGGGATSQDDVVRANDGSLVDLGSKL